MGKKIVIKKRKQVKGRGENGKLYKGGNKKGEEGRRRGE